MILVGTILADVRLKDLVSKDTCYYSLIRLFVIPLLVLIGCRIGHAESLVTGVCVVLSGMPAASTAAVMAAKYQTDEIFATKMRSIFYIVVHDHRSSLVPVSWINSRKAHVIYKNAKGVS